jgi:hypothetical protein
MRLDTAAWSDAAEGRHLAGIPARLKRAVHGGREQSFSVFLVREAQSNLTLEGSKRSARGEQPLRYRGGNGQKQLKPLQLLGFEGLLHCSG